jgi:hypothetical protein
MVPGRRTVVIRSKSRIVVVGDDSKAKVKSVQTSIYLSLLLGRVGRALFGGYTWHKQFVMHLYL